MEANLFTLVNPSDHDQIFAFGMEIAEEDSTTAVVYRRDPVSGRSMLGQHRSAESALARYGRRIPLALVWEDDEDADEADDE